MSFLDTIWLWGAGLGIGTIVVLVALAVLAPSVLTVVAAFLKPLAESVGNALAATVKWLWESIFLPGVIHIFKSTPALVTICVVGYVVWFGAQYEADRAVAAAQASLNACKDEGKAIRTELQKTRNQLKAAEKRLTKPATPGWF